MVQMFISYKDEDDNKVDGFFDVINPNDNGFIVFKTSKNIVHIPLARVLKIKRDIKGVEE